MVAAHPAFFKPDVKGRLGYPAEMRYHVAFTRRAEKDLAGLPRTLANRIATKLVALREDMQGDVKRLTNMTPEYRLRAGDYRILFEVKGNRITIHRISHRRDIYRR